MKASAAWLVFVASLVLAWHVPAHPAAAAAARLAAGIHEDIPARDAALYRAWKQEFLSTDLGRRQ